MQKNNTQLHSSMIENASKNLYLCFAGFLGGASSCFERLNCVPAFLKHHGNM
jgi:hypothetical protein